MVTGEDCYKIKPETWKADVGVILRRNEVCLILGTGGNISFSGKPQYYHQSRIFFLFFSVVLCCAQPTVMRHPILKIA